MVGSLPMRARPRRAGGCVRGGITVSRYRPKARITDPEDHSAIAAGSEGAAPMDPWTPNTQNLFFHWLVSSPLLHAEKVHATKSLREQWWQVRAERWAGCQPPLITAPDPGSLSSEHSSLAASAGLLDLERSTCITPACGDHGLPGSACGELTSGAGGSSLGRLRVVRLKSVICLGPPSTCTCAVAVESHSW